jgi:hypothetical protein
MPIRANASITPNSTRGIGFVSTQFAKRKEAKQVLIPKSTPSGIVEMPKCL